MSRSILLTLALALAGTAQGQSLDPTFPTQNSSVSNTAAAFLDLGTRQSDRAVQLVPRPAAGGVTMVFHALDESGAIAYSRVGLRRLLEPPAFGNNVSTDLLHATSGYVRDGIEVAGRLCLLEGGFDSGPLVPYANLRCYGDDGTPEPAVATPGNRTNRVPGALGLDGNDLVVAGTQSNGGGNDEYELYFETRRASDLALIGTRTTHGITVANPAVTAFNFLKVTAMQRDASGRWLVGGSVRRGPSPSTDEAWLARFNADFTRDSSFGDNGVVNLLFGNANNGQFFNATLTDIAVLDTGHIVAAGTGCKAVTCGTFENGLQLTRQALTRLLRADGASLSYSEAYVSASHVTRFIEVEATRSPYLPGKASGYVRLASEGDNSALVSSVAVAADGTQTTAKADFITLRYTGLPTTTVPQSPADLVTTRDGGVLRHYAAWTYRTNFGNAEDTDMLIGRLQPLVSFANGFE